ncbi:lipoprotein, partial [Vibrio metschnikovii]
MFNFSNGFYMKRICLLLGLTLVLAGCASTNTDA